MLPTGFGWSSDLFLITLAFAVVAAVALTVRERVRDHRQFTARSEAVVVLEDVRERIVRVPQTRVMAKQVVEVPGPVQYRYLVGSPPPQVRYVDRVKTVTKVEVRHVPPKGQRTSVYRYYSTDDQLLYVGIAMDPQERARQHARTQRWWPEVARHDTWELPTRYQARAVELFAIEHEHPRYNAARGSLSDQYACGLGPRRRVTFDLPPAAEWKALT